MASTHLLIRSSTVASVLAWRRRILAFFGSTELRREESGQVRPYVRPAPRRPPLAIMGARRRARHQPSTACSKHIVFSGVA
jgi:hypothetical protein